MKYKKWDIVLADLSPTKGTEIYKTRPCIVVSPPSVNDFYPRLTLIPLTSKAKGYPFRMTTLLNGKTGEACLDQIRIVDKLRVQKKLGILPPSDRSDLQALMMEYFLK